MSFSLASLFVDIRADQAPFNKALDSVHQRLSAGSVAVGTFVGNVASMFAKAAIGAAGGLFEGTIKSASNLNEAISKTQTIFGDAAGTIITQTEEMAKTFGLPKREMLDAAGVMGLMAKGTGQSAQASAEFSNKMVKLAADAKSFYTVPFEEALGKIRAGLSGESEPLRAFGVFLTEDAVKAEALAMGLGKGHKELTEGEKIMARSSLITKGMADASGDLERTISGTENQTQKFWGTLANLGQEIGTTLLPAWDKLLAIATSTMSNISAQWESGKGTFKSWVDAISEGIDVIAIAWDNWPTMVEISQLSASASLTNFTDTLMSWVATVGEYLLMPADYLTKGFIAAAPIIGGVWDSILNGIVSAWNSFVGTMASGIDFLLRPINDLRIALGGTAISIEELINKTQIKPPKAIVTGILETGANVWESGVAKAKEELAALAKPTDISAVTNRIAELTQQMSDKVAANTKNITDAAKPPPKAFVPPTAAVTKEAKMEVSGVAEFASKLRLAQGAPDLPQKQLTELQEIRKQEAENGKALTKLAEGGFGMALG